MARIGDMRTRERQTKLKFSVVLFWKMTRLISLWRLTHFPLYSNDFDGVNIDHTNFGARSAWKLGNISIAMCVWKDQVKQ